MKHKKTDLFFNGPIGTRRGLTTENAWSSGVVDVKTEDGKPAKRYYDVKHFPEGSDYGIQGGRISKLSIKDDTKRHCATTIADGT
ncbi:MAG: hypothetical protein VB031_02215 [Eubacteriaceae bacterium]|nr:hypothetical protein [Eubacteriaceae bacterium]